MCIRLDYHVNMDHLRHTVFVHFRISQEDSAGVSDSRCSAAAAVHHEWTSREAEATISNYILAFCLSGCGKIRKFNAYEGRGQV